mmetsp:Transcript_12592/g.33811  ORF Transcript_12592/g.33811 Transcript_12592/m.33811 type:complete len:202 (-) Transcript_12592:24-629(-)
MSTSGSLFVPFAALTMAIETCSSVMISETIHSTKILKFAEATTATGSTPKVCATFRRYVSTGTNAMGSPTLAALAVKVKIDKLPAWNRVGANEGTNVGSGDGTSVDANTRFDVGPAVGPSAVRPWLGGDGVGDAVIPGDWPLSIVGGVGANDGDIAVVGANAVGEPVGIDSRFPSCARKPSSNGPMIMFVVAPPVAISTPS